MINRYSKNKSQYQALIFKTAVFLVFLWSHQKEIMILQPLSLM